MVDARDIRALQAQITDLQAQIRNMVRVATVTSFDATNNRLVAQDQSDGDSDRLQTPPIPFLHQSGAVQRRATISAGEQVLVISPCGQFGPASFAIPIGSTETNPSPSAAEVEDVTIVGETTQRLLPEQAELTSKRVDLGATGGPAVARVGDMVQIDRGSSRGLWPIVTGAKRTFAQ
ncbi:phage baseplate assembly protein V [Polycladidibacter stylochi]|uniref:phage baseplate assembly protein V n=1 Tax=Polycladidibacter stylochi TaxID=1807766 RepID=UPI00082B40F6|nr:phage baseplate assembly protein V [Pseudovibrio stylochi]